MAVTTTEVLPSNIKKNKDGGWTVTLSQPITVGLDSDRKPVLQFEFSAAGTPIDGRSFCAFSNDMAQNGGLDALYGLAASLFSTSKSFLLDAPADVVFFEWIQHMGTMYPFLGENSAKK